MPCLALRCSAVLRCALFQTRSSTRYHAIPGTDRYVCTCVILFFSLSLFDCPLLVLLFFLQKYTHTGNQNETWPTNTHGITQGNQLCVWSSSWHYQIARCTKSWASSFCRRHIYCIPPCGSVAGGVSRPRSGALVHSYQALYTRTRHCALVPGSRCELCDGRKYKYRSLSSIYAAVGTVEGSDLNFTPSLIPGNTVSGPENERFWVAQPVCLSCRP